MTAVGSPPVARNMTRRRERRSFHPNLLKGALKAAVAMTQAPKNELPVKFMRGVSRPRPLLWGAPVTPSFRRQRRRCQWHAPTPEIHWPSAHLSQ